MIHDNVLLISLLLMLVVLGAFIFVVMNSGTATDYGPIKDKAYRLRSKLFLVIVIAGVFVAVGTLDSLPYTKNINSMASLTKVNVEGKQWYWDLSQDHAPVNTPVAFRVTSGDVNHGLGIYNSELRLLAQTQAMPGYTNELVYTFKQPGEYQLMCLEYCGLVHHAMISTFTVEAQTPATTTEM
jgi:cytochrome c oxidase subunit 2